MTSVANAGEAAAAMRANPARMRFMGSPCAGASSCNRRAAPRPWVSLRSRPREWTRCTRAGTGGRRYVRHIDRDEQYIGRMARADAILAHMASRAVVRLVLAHPIVGASVAFLVRS